MFAIEYVRDQPTPHQTNYAIIGTSPSQEKLPKHAPIFIAVKYIQSCHSQFSSCCVTIK